MDISPEDYSKFKKTLLQKRCFYINCEHKSIKSHSIQEAGPLDLLADYVGTERGVYCLDDDYEKSKEANVMVSKQKVKRTLQFEGTGVASTFFGFCGEHEKIFITIENNNPYVASREHHLLHTYRAFAYSMHKNFEIFTRFNDAANNLLNTFSNLLDAANPVVDKLNEALEQLKKTEPAAYNKIKSMEQMKTVENYGKLSAEGKATLEQFDKEVKHRLLGDRLRKARFDQAIENKDDKQLIYYSRTVVGVYPFSCAATIQFLDRFMQPSSDGIVYAPDYAVVVIPEKQSSNTHFIISAFGENANVSILFSRLHVMTDTVFLKFMSDLLLSRGHNMYISPRMYKKMTDAEKLLLLSTRINISHQGIQLPEINLNLFDSRFKE